MCAIISEKFRIYKYFSVFFHASLYVCFHILKVQNLWVCIFQISVFFHVSPYTMRWERHLYSRQIKASSTKLLTSKLILKTAIRAHIIIYLRSQQDVYPAVDPANTRWESGSNDKVLIPVWISWNQSLWTIFEQNDLVIKKNYFNRIK